MQRLTARTAPKLTPAERKAEVDALVARGELTPERAKLIDFREPTAKERARAETLVPKGREALARAARRVA